MSLQYFDTQRLRQDLQLFDMAIEKVAFTPAPAPPPPMTQMPPQGAPMDPNAMPPGGAPMDPNGQPMPMDPNGQPMDPNAMPPGASMDPNGQPMDPNAMPPGAPMDPNAMPPGGVDPEMEGMLAQLAEGVTGMGNEVLSQRDQIDQLTQRLLQIEQQMSSMQDGLKAPAGLEQSEEQTPIPGQSL